MCRSQVDQTFTAGNRHNETPAGPDVSHSASTPSLKEKKLEKEKGNAAFMPVQTLTFSLTAVSKGVNQCQLWQPEMGLVPPMQLLS